MAMPTFGHRHLNPCTSFGLLNLLKYWQCNLLLMFQHWFVGWADPKCAKLGFQLGDQHFRMWIYCHVSKFSWVYLYASKLVWKITWSAYVLFYIVLNRISFCNFYFDKICSSSFYYSLCGLSCTKNADTPYCSCLYIFKSANHVFYETVRI
jgi:hypothetical protein